MALLIRAIGQKGSRVESVYPKDGRVFTLEELQAYVGGYVEALKLVNGFIMWLNEDGKAMRLPFNLIANQLAHDTTGIAHCDTIVGDVVIANYIESGEDA